MRTIRGRDAEFGLLTGLLEEAAAGRSAFALVEGGPGSGKTGLLTEVMDAARARGFAAGRVTADHLGAPDFPVSLGLDPGALRDPAAPPAELLRRLGEQLGSGPPGRPVLVVLDDLQWAAPDTVVALRELSTRQLPAAFFLARQPGGGGCRMDRLFSALADHGAVRCVLGPLAESAVAQVLADALGAEPSAELLDLCSAEEGAPGALLDLADALLATGSLTVGQGLATPVSGPLPPQVRSLVLRPLTGLSAGSRSLLDVAAVVGRSFALADLTSLLRLSALELLPAVQELVSSGLLESTGCRLGFRRELVWRCVRDELPPPVRSALLRDLGGALMREGEYLSAAERLAEAVQAGESRAVEDLERAARELLKVSPRRAVDLASEALDPVSGSSVHSRLQVITVLGLAAEGKLARAAETARVALAGSCDPMSAAELRHTLASIDLMTGAPSSGASGAAGTADWSALLWPGLTAAHSRRIDALRARASYRPGDPAAADAQAEALRSAGEPESVVAAGLLRGVTRWHSGLVAEALTEIRSVQDFVGPGSVAGYVWDSRPMLATMLIQLRRLDEADLVIGELSKELADLDLPAWNPLVLAPRALLALVAGALDDADTHAQAVLDAYGGAQIGAAVLVALSVQTEVALRRGDQHQVAECARRLRALMDTVCLDAGVGHGLLTLLRVAQAQDGPGGVLRTLADLGQGAETTLRAVSLAGPAVPAWLVRAAETTGDHVLAQRIVALAQETAALNPGVRILADAAVHADAVLRGSVTALRRATAGHLDPWARTQAEEDLGLLLLEDAPRTGGDVPYDDRMAAADHLQAALRGYQEAGSAPDTARVRSLLRRLGVRSRHWTYDTRPSTGWGSLTPTERAVADLVATGLTNREAARQMFLSPHTVNFHLRQVFRKLGIGSRVELARMHRDDEDG
ncbi:DNA-binding CsgD family transcriptional regulator [Kitasatospora sp. MAP12-15]|uniref:helix-turn-helix transcriptional regulator n=1 Tax=unclassified Kitasatospora TaxID=2633591 RepID=UPI0024762CC9|nr:LuxR C-terminal-related transcriptional regulator [Kitasatospora sp. MAP12-44]MDH6115446.1 DNA-binding CsgD family transcriptional regulator [Kitasatospora sp. MAP12-44]